MNARPTFFISSTIYDFKDLRGAIKYLLESRGCRVLASEYNDFHGNLDKHSYEACLENIDQADYFVLLIGSRVGGWYDAAKRVSITQQEYRHAYERHKAGLLRLVVLVRADVWQVREDRKALARHLATLELTDKERRDVQTFPSPFASDADHVSSFIAEVGRNLETARAVKEGKPKPTGNWISVFSTFRDVVDVLHPLTFGGLTADQAAFRKALQSELLSILARLLLKLDGRPIDPRTSLVAHVEQYAISLEERDNSRIEIQGKEWDKFSFWFYSLIGLQITTTILPEALTSTLFLVYDQKSGTYVQTEAYEAIVKLADEIRKLNSLATTETLATIIEFSPKSRGGKEYPVYIPATKLALLHGLAFRWTNVIALCASLAVHLEGEVFQMPALKPLSPVRGLQDEIDKEQVSLQEARTYLGL